MAHVLTVLPAHPAFIR